ncbi:GspH/FimT family pseudopilin [Flocculibacter collagenilyticus]|uniref:GspH/FimT family pseudopilin n=1 Tax=Flocculibacter collagenilyticus TaxID=2744479 RepID=UPI0018F3ECDA|nr:GspH/FimT family pseudopilin [Flocculibacter collagenilyticus]
MKKNGFTLLEVLVVVGIVGILASIALPNLSSFLESNRVENKLQELNRLFAYARGEAISGETFVTVCPLVNRTCTNDWSKEIVAFIDDNNNQTREANEAELRVSGPLNSNDFLQFANAALTYESRGMLANNDAGGRFIYCPSYKNNINSRSLDITPLTGRATISDNTVTCN